MIPNNMYCHKCGKELDGGALYCSYCGASVNGSMDDTVSGKAAPNIPYAHKNVGVSLVLGFFIPGLGHIYIGKLVRGICILIAYILLESLILFQFFTRYDYNYLTYSDVTGILALTVLLSILSFILMIWNLFDVNRLGKEYNDCIRKGGDPPW